MKLTWKTTELENGLPLLEAMVLRIPTAQRTFLRKTCSKGRVSRAGRRLAAATPVFQGDMLEMFASQRMVEILSDAPLQPNQLLFEDRHAMVVEKAAGLIVHRSDRSTESLQEQVQQFVKARGDAYRVAPAHRLDIGTSGPVMFGKGVRSAGMLGKLFMAGTVHKSYLAVVCGLPPQEGRLNSPVPAHGKLKPSSTRFRRLDRTREFTLLQLSLETGRLHQLRRQLADAGWPILGDSRYRGAAWPGLDHPFLHCCLLGFMSVEEKTWREVECPPPEQLLNILNQTGLSLILLQSDPRLHQQ